MIERDDLRAAVAAGIISEAQAVSVNGLATARRGARSDLAPGDEPFELFKGFNEIFIVVGLSILSFGWITVGVAFLSPGDGGLMQQIYGFSAVSAALIWALSEYFVRRRRMVAPAIALSILWGMNAVLGFSPSYAEPFMIGQEDF